MPNYTLADGITVKNKHGATSHDALEAAETDFVANRLLGIELGLGPSGQFDTAHLKAIHRHLFQDIYEWAGRTRDESVTLSDGTLATEPVLRKPGSKPFLAGPRIRGALGHIPTSLRRSAYLRGPARREFAAKAADVMVALNGVHPFREGNGRTQRAFVRALARERVDSLAADNDNLGIALYLAGGPDDMLELITIHK